LILEYDNVILGSSIDAFLLGSQNFWPVIFSDFEKPFRFDYCSPDLDLSKLNLPKKLERKSLTTFDGKFAVGPPKHLLWERLYFAHSLRGLVPLSDLCKSIRTSDNKLTCFNEYSKIAEIKFNNCYYFGDNNVIDLFNEKNIEDMEYLCYDWIAFNKGGKHEIDHFTTSDNFCQQVWFYPSDRIDGNTSVKDACVVSLLNSKQLADFDYSETMARFKLIDEMEKRGMKGLFNGYTSAGNPKHYKFKTTHIRREKHAITKIHKIASKGFKKPPSNKKIYNQMLQSACLDSNVFLRKENE
tara:strand:+ start:283 stop:1176 length:894 start_codon:yes stop_codon:yes gene_type:complete